MIAENNIIELPRWAVMWLLAAGLFFAGKAAALVGSGLRGWGMAGFALLWAGMDTKPFLPAGGTRVCKDRGLISLLASSSVNMITGTCLLWGVARHCTNPLVAGWAGMVGVIFLFHCGVFTLLAAAWRALGVPVTPIMRCPVAATSLAEFWGRRWNLAFRDLAHRLVFTPVSRRVGHGAALWASFGASGLAHELVVSVPAGAGYGLPTAYFLLQALGITLERRMGRVGRFAGWLRTHAFTTLPLFLAFHPAFVERVMVPFLRSIGALP